MKIVCFGDSLTFGSVGYSYIRYINKKYTVINKGINGDTIAGVYKRLRRFINNPKNDDIDIYVIAIGTNDLLLPYLSTISPLWNLQMKPRVKECITDNKAFITEYHKILELILNHSKAVITVGIPLLQLNGYPNENVQSRNLMIKKLASQTGVSFIDSAALQQNAVPHMTLLYSWKHKNLVRIFDGLIMLLFPFSKDWFSKLRCLELTVDGAHFNSRAAKLIGEAINKSLAP